MLQLIVTRRNFIAIFLIFIPLNVYSSPLKLSLVADFWPPFTSEKQGQRIAADLVEEALRNSGVEPETKIIPWHDVLKGLRSNNYDAIVGAWKTSDREEFLLFSKPYLENRIKLIGRTDNKIEFKTINQLAGKKLALVDGYAYGVAVTGNDKIVKVVGQDVVENIKMLLDKKVDYILADAIVAQGIKEYLPPKIKDNLVVYEKLVEAQNLHFAIRKNHPQAKVILEKFDAAISNMIADGSYNRILGFSWVIADSNSDGVQEYIAGVYLGSTIGDPMQSGVAYSVFAGKELPAESSPRKYRVGNREFESWDEASAAIAAEGTRNKSPQNKAIGTFDFLLGEF